MLTLSPARFNAFLNKVGQTCAWRRAYACPCLNPDSGAGNPRCLRCHGKGHTWANAVTGTAAPCSQKVQQAWAMAGMFEPGDVVVTVGSDSPLYALSLFDRVLLLNDQQGFSEVLTRGVNDTLRSPPSSVLRVFWLDEDQVEVEGALPIVASDNSLSWVAGAPPSGFQYSVTGMRHPEYFVWNDYPQDRAHFHGQTLPRKVVLRRFDLFGRG